MVIVTTLSIVLWVWDESWTVRDPPPKLSLGLNGPSCMKLALETLQGSQQCIHIMAYSMDADVLDEMLCEKVKSGIEVLIMVDYAHRKGFQRLRISNLCEYKVIQNTTNRTSNDGRRNYYGNLHHKTIIVDRQHIVNGSFNFTKNAMMMNFENTMLVHGSRTIAEQFLEEFDRIWNNEDFHVKWDQIRVETNLVFVTKRSGKKYHRIRDCMGLKTAKEVQRVQTQIATKRGLSPCIICYKHRTQ